MLAAIINQKPLQTVKKHIHWEAVLDVSDYQEVINIVYVGLLGIEKNISEDCTEEFHQSYRRSLLLYEAYVNAEEVIKWQLERHGIEALFLLDTGTGDMYPKPEMTNIRQMEILVDKKDMTRINRLMRDMDYEQREEMFCSGVIYVRVPGIRIVFYDEMPIENKVVQGYFSGPVRRYRRAEPYQYIHTLTNEEEYLYRAARMVDLYITGKLKIRDIMELWQFRKLLGEKFRWKTVKEYLDRAQWLEFVCQAEILATLWFGEDAEQQYSLALELEEYIISRGRENKHLDEVLLPCEKVRLDFYWRNRDKEWALRKQAWMFPARDYMIRFFPILEKYPYLLVFCWLIRNWRFFKRICTNKYKKVGFRLRVRLLDIKEKLKGLVKRKREEESELPEEKEREGPESPEAGEREESPELPEAVHGEPMPQADDGEGETRGIDAESGSQDIDAAEDAVDQGIDAAEDVVDQDRDMAEDAVDQDRDVAEDAVDRDRDIAEDAVDQDRDVAEDAANIEEIKGENNVKESKDQN